MTVQNGYKFLKPEDIRKLSTFEFAPKALVEGYFAGRHRSQDRGSSVEFRDYRQYVQGDDRALIDWRCYARTDRHYIRTYEQETNMECHIFLDSSASMGFGKKISKLDFASFFAAALCYLVLRTNDRVSLQIFDKDIRKFFPPGSTSRHLQQVMTALERNVPGEETSLATALHRSFPLLKCKGTLIVLSDFFDDRGAIFDALSPYIHRGFRIHLFHILDPQEMTLSNKGLVRFEDMENASRIVAHTDDLQKAYSDAIARHITNLRALARRRNVDYVATSTDTHYFHLFDRLTR